MITFRSDCGRIAMDWAADSNVLKTTLDGSNLKAIVEIVWQLHLKARKRYEHFRS